MKQFFGAFFGSVIGIIIATIIGAIIFAALLTSGLKSAFQSDESLRYKSKPKSVLHLVFQGEITDREKKDPFSQIDFGRLGKQYKMGQDVVIKNIENAAKDSSVRGIYMNFKDLMIIDRKSVV